MTALRLRSFLFCPAVRPELLEKGVRSGADAVVLDLEDGVSTERKHEGRAFAGASIAALPADARSATLLIRINPVDSPYFDDDISSLPTGVHGVVVPKVEDPTQVAAVRSRLEARSAIVVLGIETVVGVRRIDEILGVGADAVYFGAEDYIEDLGGRRTTAGLEVLHARSEVAMSARVHGVTPIDQAVVEIRDDDRFRSDASTGRSLGYRGKICIHPAQVKLANSAFAPTADEVDRARRLLEAFELAVADGRAVIEVDGRVVDGPVVRAARAVLAAHHDD